MVHRSREVVGRSDQLEAIDRFLGGGDAHSLVLEGEAGIGKSMLWLAGIEMAGERGYEVLRARPAAVEGLLLFTGLHDLLAAAPRSARQRLPEVQRRSLAVALAEDEARSFTVERGVLGVAVLGLLRELSAERPLLLAIDDLHCLDESSAAVVVYALRRLGDARIRMLASCRGPLGGPLPFSLERVLTEGSLIRLEVGPLSEGAIRRIVRLQAGLSLPRIKLHALYEAAGGNPFYSLQLARSGLDLDSAGSIRLPLSLHELACVPIEMLPAGTRDALLYVAPLAGSSERVLSRAGVRELLQPALEAGVLERDSGRMCFADPLVATAVWGDADERRRREVHVALAEADDDPERRVWHLAAAADVPNADLADRLEKAAESAHMRGAPSAAADLLDRALELTPSGDCDRWGRLGARAAAAHAAVGHWDSVWELVALAQERLPAGAERAAILVAAAEMRPGLEQLLRQAVAEAGETPIRVRALIGLCEQAGFSGQFCEAIDVAREAVALARVLGDDGVLGVALTWLGALKYLDSQLDGRKNLAEARAIERELGGLPASVFHSPRTYQAFALTFGDDPLRARAVLEERVVTAVERGDEMSAFQALRVILLAELLAGDWRAARRTARAALDLVQVIGYEYGRPILLGSLAQLEALEGRLDRARDLGSEAVSSLTALGDRFWSTFGLASLLFTELCAADASAALAHADAISERYPGRECWWSYHQGDEIEALVLAGQHERALSRAAVLRLAGNDLGLPRFLAWADRGEGLVCAARGDLVAAQGALESALSHHQRFPLAFERARTLLAYGSVLRRLKRRRAARAALGEALAEFERLGAAHFVHRVQAELKHVGGRAPAGEHELTGAEERIARLVAAGHSNKEVAAELYIAVSTVEATLTRVYRKLGLSSRSQLAHALSVRDVDLMH